MLLAQVANDGRLSDELFSQLVELLNACLREAAAASDFKSTQILIPILFHFHRIENGAEDFIYVCIDTDSMLILCRKKFDSKLSGKILLSGRRISGVQPARAA